MSNKQLSEQRASELSDKLSHVGGSLGYYQVWADGSVAIDTNIEATDLPAFAELLLQIHKEVTQ